MGSRETLLTIPRNYPPVKGKSAKIFKLIVNSTECMLKCRGTEQKRTAKTGVFGQSIKLAMKVFIDTFNYKITVECVKICDDQIDILNFIFLDHFHNGIVKGCAIIVAGIVIVDLAVVICQIGDYRQTKRVCDHQTVFGFSIIALYIPPGTARLPSR